jgi:predicted  nucleic acid-binding Zn-ribbon protein
MPKRPTPSEVRRRITRSSPRPGREDPQSILRGKRITATSSVAAGAAFLALNSQAAHAEIADDISALQESLSDFQSRSSYQRIAADISQLDHDLQHALNILESARAKGYAYQSDLEDIAYKAMDRWQSIRNQVEDKVQSQAKLMHKNASGLNNYLKRLNANIHNPKTAHSILQTTETHVNDLLLKLQATERTLQDNYRDIQSQVYQLNSRLADIHWVLDQSSEAEFELARGEDMVMGVPARWDKEGKDDPEGVLYLTNQRLIFERKEKIATKKVLFITTSSELVQELMIDQLLKNVKDVKAINKGLFGHQDFLEVEFTEHKFGSINFHIDGQNSDDWKNLIEKAKTGAIEAERASGAGLSFSDLTGPLTDADLVSIQNEVNQLQKEMMLDDVQNELTELENEVRSLERRLKKLRARGYAVEKNLEADVAILSTQWDRIKQRAESILTYQLDLLKDQMTVIQTNLSTLMSKSNHLSAARSDYVQLKSAIASAEAQLDTAEVSVLDQFDEYADEIDSLSAHFDWVDWMLDALSTASFQLLATESGVAAVEAVWERPGLEPENGILYLTDQRLLWEDRVGDFELKINVHVRQIGGVKEDAIGQNEQEVLLVKFDDANVPVSEGKFGFSVPVVEEWIKMIGRARAGDFTKDRAIELSEKDLESIRNAPQQCQNCGAAFTAPILRGQVEIICEYCGVVTRI